MKAAVHDITIQQGATFRLAGLLRQKATGLPVDFTGATARFVVKAAYGGPTLMDLATGGGGITLGGVDGTFEIVGSDAVTGAIEVALAEGRPPARACVYAWDVTWADGSKSRLAEGRALVTRKP